MNAAFDPSDFMPDMMFDDEFLTHYDIEDDGKGPRLLHTDFFNGAKTSDATNRRLTLVSDRI